MADAIDSPTPRDALVVGEDGELYIDTFHATGAVQGREAVSALDALVYLQNLIAYSPSEIPAVPFTRVDGTYEPSSVATLPRAELVSLVGSLLDRLADEIRRANPSSGGAAQAEILVDAIQSAVIDPKAVAPTGLRIAGAPVRVAVNVARDSVAGAELKRSAAILDELAGAPVAAVVARGRSELPGGASAVVVAQEWIDSAELALLPSRRGGRRLYAVERWLTADDAPGRIRGAAGHALDDREHVEAACCAAEVLLDAARPERDDRIRFPRIAVAHGDWTWVSGRVHVVATACDHDHVSRTRVRAHVAEALSRGGDDPGPAVRALLRRGAEQACAAARVAGHPTADLLEGA